MAAARAIDSATFAILSDGKHRVAFDRVVDVMKETDTTCPASPRDLERRSGQALQDGVAASSANGGVRKYSRLRFFSDPYSMSRSHVKNISHPSRRQ